jgi:hypothetical protein
MLRIVRQIALEDEKKKPADCVICDRQFELGNIRNRALVSNNREIGLVCDSCLKRGTDKMKKVLLDRSHALTVKAELKRSLAAEYFVIAG